MNNKINQSVLIIIKNKTIKIILIIKLKKYNKI